MIICIQRVHNASVLVDKEVKGTINKGLCIFVGVEKDDEAEIAQALAIKTCELRIFPDKTGKMSFSLIDIQGEVLSISQFTLAADMTKGKRPDFKRAAVKEKALYLYDLYTNTIRSIIGADKVSTGVFGADMTVNVTNDGPVTLILERR